MYDFKTHCRKVEKQRQLKQEKSRPNKEIKKGDRKRNKLKGIFEKWPHPTPKLSILTSHQSTKIFDPLKKPPKIS